MPGGCISEGIIYDPPTIAKYVEKLIKEPSYGQITANRINLAISEQYIFTRVLELPEMSAEDMLQAINWDAEQYIPISINNLYVDYQVLGPALSGKEGNSDVALIAVPKAIVDSYLNMADTLNLEVASIETNLSSIARAAIPQKDEKEATVLVDIGGDRTNLAIFDKAIRVTGTFPEGGVDFTKAIADELKMNILEAEELKNHEGLSGKKGKVKDAMAPTLLNVVDEIKKIINYYQEKAGNGLTISKILLCGGNASVPGLAEFIESQTNLTTVMGSPWANISVYPLKPVPKLEAPMYTAAIGLALRGLKDA